MSDGINIERPFISGWDSVERIGVREPHCASLQSASIDDLCIPFQGRTL